MQRISAGQIVAGRYELLARLGAGTEAETWLAEELEARAHVAVKRWHLPRRLSEDNGERFLRNVRAQAQLHHPGLVDILDAGFDEHGHAFLVTAALHGETLAERLARGPLSEDEAVDVFTQLCNALAVVHDAHLVHRDLKPSNVFLENAGRRIRVRLLDFGISLDLLHPRHTPHGVQVGTPLYMAPELLTTDAEPSSAADVWAVGVMLHEAVAGVLPFAGTTIPELAREITSGVQDRAFLNAGRRWRWALVNRCLQPDPSGRYRNAREIADALAEIRAFRPGVGGQNPSFAKG